MQKKTVSQNTADIRKLLRQLAELHAKGVITDSEYESLVKFIGAEFVASEINDIFTEMLERNLNKWLSYDELSYAR